MIEIRPIINRVIGHCDPYCGCQYFEVLQDDKICVHGLSREDQIYLEERNNAIEAGEHLK